MLHLFVCFLSFVYFLFKVKRFYSEGGAPNKRVSRNVRAKTEQKYEFDGLENN